MGDKYTQHDGYDKYKNVNKDTGKTENRGKATYNDNGTLKRLDNYSPVANESDKHWHEWLKQNSDGSYTYDHGKHDNH